MKTVIFLTLFLSLTNIAMAEQNYDSPYTKLMLENFPEGSCLKAAVIGLHIVKKIDDTHFETVTIAGNQIVSRGVLETNKSQVKGKGLVTIGVKYLGSKQLPLDDGFDGSFGLWQECQ